MIRSPFEADGLLEVKDVIDRRVSYVVVWDESEETLGLIAWLSRRMVCLCSAGRQVYEDRLDGSLRWQDEGCSHEVTYLAVKRRREAPAGISAAYGVNAGMYE